MYIYIGISFYFTYLSLVVFVLLRIHVSTYLSICKTIADNNFLVKSTHHFNIISTCQFFILRQYFTSFHVIDKHAQILFPIVFTLLIVSSRKILAFSIYIKNYRHYYNMVIATVTYAVCTYNIFPILYSGQHVFMYYQLWLLLTTLTLVPSRHSVKCSIYFFIRKQITSYTEIAQSNTFPHISYVITHEYLDTNIQCIKNKKNKKINKNNKIKNVYVIIKFRFPVLFVTKMFSYSSGGGQGHVHLCISYTGPPSCNKILHYNFFITILLCKYVFDYG